MSLTELNTQGDPKHCDGARDPSTGETEAGGLWAPG